MKNTICEKLMWSAMTPAIFKYIAAHCKNTDTSRVKKKSRKNFKDMLARTPDIGGFTKNPLRICLPGRDTDEYTINYHRCGLCALGKQEHLEELIPYMCAMDFISVDLMGGVLYRTGTLAEGAEKCDFYVCKKDSKWDKERKYGQQAELQKQGGLGKWNM